jgi:hypothetical protein
MLKQDGGICSCHRLDGVEEIWDSPEGQENIACARASEISCHTHVMREYLVQKITARYLIIFDQRKALPENTVHDIVRIY